MDNNGGAAFPELESSYVDHKGLTQHCSSGGMTLRDYFAASAMQGFCANERHAMLDGPDSFEESAQEAYQVADAMLAARSK